MAKASSNNKANQKYEGFARTVRTPELCPFCFEENAADQVNGDLYRCGACGKAFVFGYFYDLWLAKHQSSASPS